MRNVPGLLGRIVHPASQGDILIVYPIGSSDQTIILSDTVVGHLKRYRQMHNRQREAGGQLFARFDRIRIIVEEATGPRRSDRRTRISYTPSRFAERREINSRYKRGLHYIGDWHTHPERIPSPSIIDIRSIGDCVTKSEHSLNGFILIVVGPAEPPDGFHTSLHDGVQNIELKAVTESAKNFSSGSYGVDETALLRGPG